MKSFDMHVDIYNSFMAQVTLRIILEMNGIFVSLHVSFSRKNLITTRKITRKVASIALMYF